MNRSENLETQNTESAMSLESLPKGPELSAEDYKHLVDLANKTFLGVALRSYWLKHNPQLVENFKNFMPSNFQKSTSRAAPPPEEIFLSNLRVYGIKQEQRVILLLGAPVYSDKPVPGKIIDANGTEGKRLVFLPPIESSILIKDPEDPVDQAVQKDLNSAFT